MHWKVLSSEYLFTDPPWLKLKKEKCLLPNGVTMPSYYILEYPSWCSAFALTEDNKVVMVKQYRHGLGVISTELPGGVVDAGEEPQTAIKRELLEETGYEFSSFEYMGKLSANPATSNNYMHMYLAKGGKLTSRQRLDETEDVEVLLYSLDEVAALVRENKIVQALHTASIFYAFQRLGYFY